MAYRVGQVVQQPIPSYGEVTDKAEAAQLQQQDRQLRAMTLQEAVEQRRAKAEEAQAQAADVAKKQAFLKQAFTTYRHDNGRPDLDAIADEFEKAYPEDGVKFRSDLALTRQRVAQTKKMEFENHRDIGQISGRMLRTTNPQNYAQVRQEIVRLDPEADAQLPPQFDPAAVQELIKRSDALTGEFDDKAKAADSFDTKPLEWFGRNAKYIRSQADLDELYDDAALKLRAPELRELKRAYGDQYSPEWNANAEQVAVSLQKAPKAATAPNLGSFEDYVIRKFGPDPTPQQIEQARKAYNQADDRPAQSGTGSPSQSNDVKAVAQAIVNGQQPPEMTGMYRNTLALKAELARQGYDLSKATEDWKATQKHLATLNGAQQTRLRQAVAFTSESLDVIDDLNEKWKGGKFPLLNKAQLAAAKSGVLGAEAQTIATQLDSQISDLVSELGTVYKGGNSSTDESLKLAAENLKSNWSYKQLQDAVTLVRRNLKIRQNSIMNTGVVANEGNPYAPKTGGSEPASAPQWEWDAKLGKLVKKGGG